MAIDICAIALPMALLLSASLLQLSLPPFNLGLLVFFAFVPALVALKSLPSYSWFYAGFIIGVCWHLQLVFSLLAWTSWLYLGVCVLSGLLVGSAFLISSIAKKYVPAAAEWLIFPLFWTLVTWIAENCLRAPISLAVSLAIEYPTLLHVSRITGAYGAEFLLALSSNLIAFMVCHGLNKTSLMASAIVLWLFAVSILPVNEMPPAHRQIIYGIQPSISHRQSEASSWSMSARQNIERRVDLLTQNASRAQEGIILWPETGNGLLNLRLSRREEFFSSLFQDGLAGVLVSGLDTDGKGNVHNVVSSYTKSGFEKTAAKSILVPLVEGDLSPGSAQVLTIGDLNAGIAICFESIFSSHIHNLAAKDANLIVAVTNDASFGNGYLTELHAAYSIMRAIEVSRPLVFLNNNGLSFSASADGEIRNIDRSGKAHQVYRWVAMLSSSEEISRNGRKVGFAVTLLIFIFVAFHERLLRRWFP